MDRNLGSACGSAVGHQGLGDRHRQDDHSKKEIQTAWGVVKGSLLLLHEYLLVWHLKSEVDLEELRKKIKEEVRLLRLQNMKEKDVCHLAVFRRCWKVLVGR